MSNLVVEMREILDEYSAEVEKVTKECAKDAAAECAVKLKANSPKSRGKYARGWTVTVKNGAYIVHNKTDYQLTHLLENGHVIKNQYGSYGRTRAVKHIEPAEQEAAKKFESLVREKL